MKPKILLLIAFFMIAGVAWLQVLPSREKPLSELIPAGALLSIEAKDFGAQLRDWNQSRIKAKWLLSQNYAAFAESNLFKKMNIVSAEYAQASGIVPGLSPLLEVAGTESALALYDPHELQFLYITKLTGARLTKSQLWALRDKFESRESAGKTFYLRGTGTRTVAFAFSGDYFFLATRDDLIARALALQSGVSAPRLADEQWYATASKASAGAGDLRMVLHLAALVKNTYFRSYWIQRNVSELQPFTTEICDLDRKGGEFVERRILLREPDALREAGALAPQSSRTALQHLVAAVPQDAGLYRGWADPDPPLLAALIEEKLLFPEVKESRGRRYAPQAPEQNNAGSDADLETRIDQPPLAVETAATGTELLQAVLSSLKVEAAIEIQSSESQAGSGFLSTPSVIGITAANDWNVAQVRDALSHALAGRVSTGGMGLQWVDFGQALSRMDGLTTLFAAARGHTIFLANSQALLSALLARPTLAPASGTDTYAASFRHARERAPYLSLMRGLDAASVSPAQFGYTSPNEPAFFSGNLGSLSDALANIHSIEVAEQQLPDRVQQTVHYF